MAAWEQDSAVWARAAGSDFLGPALQLSRSEAGQVSLAADDGGRAFAVWREAEGAHHQLMVAELVVDWEDGSLTSSDPIRVEPDSASAPQLYPAIAAGSQGVVVAWEDRRHGHTRLVYAYSEAGRAFMSPAELNEYRSGRTALDAGSGVSRVSLAANSKGEVVAVWMDKREASKGYGIWGAFSGDGGQSFGPNEKIHGPSGDALPHYSPAVSAEGDDAFIAVWDDFRKGDADLWLARFDGWKWGEETLVRPASGAGEQSSAAIAYGVDGSLHFAWVESEIISGPTRLWYLRAKRF